MNTETLTKELLYVLLNLKINSKKFFYLLKIVYICIYINTKTNKMKIDKIYYWNKKLNTYLPCVWNKTFECYTPDLQKKIEKV